MNRRQLITLALLVSAAAVSAQAAGTMLEVRETAKGTYTVTARFEVEAPPAAVRAVLTDYDRIPKFMPDVRTSIVRERRGPVVLVEQEAVSKFLLFSKKVHLLLEVEEGPRVLSFKDTSGRSFATYAGSWTIEEQSGGASLTYTLAARPSFAVPDFVIKRLLDRNARQMIEHLRAEIAARSGK